MANAATPVEMAVPLTIASPSFADSFTGKMFASARAKFAFMIRRLPVCLFLTKAVRLGLPCITPPMNDSGLRSPDAEMLPRIGILGVMSCSRSCKRF